MKTPVASSDRGRGPYLWRFSNLDRALHLAVIVSFFGLVMTGVPLHFSHTRWAQAIMRLHGGADSASIIHRVCAIITFGYFFTHIGSVFWRAARSDNWKSFFWGPNSMVPQPKDVRDMFQMFKWFVGKGPPPRFDRFSYFEKFDYWAVFWGVAIIGGSGLLLWFPEFFAGFLPGWSFNLATIIHGDEALLALGFIFTIHFFNGQLRPEKFPVDVVIFTGRARAEYMKEEHPLEYERAEREGRLAELEAPAPGRALYLWSVIAGMSLVALGFSLVVIIILTALFAH